MKVGVGWGVGMGRWVWVLGCRLVGVAGSVWVDGMEWMRILGWHG